MAGHGHPIVLREAVLSDADAVGRLHAESWRRHYRGAYLDSFLDGDIFTERQEVWRRRLDLPEPSQHTVVATAAGTLIGFAHLVRDQHPRWGALLDNLHVDITWKRSGVGSMLLSAAAAELIRTRPRSGLFLWVLAQNTAAQAFYRARSGLLVETELSGPFPGGGHAEAHRFAWGDPSVLIIDDGGRGGSRT